MMKHTLLIVFLFCLVTPAHGQTRTMAVTVDDLPYVKFREGPYVARAQSATAKILNTLKKHKVIAVGFVNEHTLDVAGQREARIDLLRQWVSDQVAPRCLWRDSRVLPSTGNTRSETRK